MQKDSIELAGKIGDLSEALYYTEREVLADSLRIREKDIIIEGQSDAYHKAIGERDSERKRSGRRGKIVSILSAVSIVLLAIVITK